MTNDYPSFDHLIDQYLPIVNEFYAKFPGKFHTEKEYEEFMHKNTNLLMKLQLWHIKCPDEIHSHCYPYEILEVGMFYEKCFVQSGLPTPSRYIPEFPYFSRRVVFNYKTFKRKIDFPFVLRHLENFIDMSGSMQDEFSTDETHRNRLENPLRGFHAINKKNGYQSPILKDKTNE